MALLGPTVLILAAAVLQIEHRITLGGIQVIFGGDIDEAVTHSIVDLRPIVDLTDLSLRDILDRVEILIRGGNIHTAAPTARAVVVEAGRIRDISSVDVQLIIVETLVLRSGLTDPDALVVLLELIFDAADIQLDGLGVRGYDTDADAALGIDLGILLAQLYVRSRLEIFLDLSVGRYGRDAQRSREDVDKSFHDKQ